MAGALTFAIPGDIETVTGGYIYDRRVMAEWRQTGIHVNHCELPASFPFPDRGDIEKTVALLNATANTAPLLMDGLAYGALPHDSARRLRSGLAVLCHHPLGLETGLARDQADWFITNEKANLQLVDLVIAPSETTAAMLCADFDVPRDKVVVAEPGTDPFPRTRGGAGGRVELLSVGSLIERKGYDLLVEALAGLNGQPWRLRIAGSPERDPAFAQRVQAMIVEAGLGAQIELIGEISRAELEQLYCSCDVFVLASRYEGYGMVLAEALSCGLAIVSTTGGAAANTVPDAAAIKVPPGDAPALRRALQQIINEPHLRQQLAGQSWHAGQALPRWDDTAKIIAQALDRVQMRVL